MAEKDRFVRFVIRLPKGMTEAEFNAPPHHNGSWYFKVACVAESLWRAPGAGSAEAVDVELADGTFVRTMVGDPRPAAESSPPCIACGKPYSLHSDKEDAYGRTELCPDQKGTTDTYVHPDTAKRCPDQQCHTLMDIDLRYCPACGTRAGLF